LSYGLGGVILSALFAAAMSSISSGVNSVTTVTMTDILSRFLPGERWKSGLTQARWLSALTGLVATLLAYWIVYVAQQRDWNIYDLMPKGFNMFLGPLAGLFFIGMFLPRCSARSAIPA